MEFHELESVYRKYLSLDHDPHLLRLIYAVVLANRYDGVPVWAMVIGRAGGGKTQLLMPMYGAEGVVDASTLTPNALLSGQGEEYSMLHRLTHPHALLIVEDMSGLSALPKESKQAIYSFFRQAFNGKLHKWHGRGDEEWSGKFGMLGGTTQAIEFDRANEAALGERFLYIRIRDTYDLSYDRELIRAALRNTGTESMMREELGEASRTFIEEFYINPDRRKLPHDLLDVISECGLYLSRARSTIQRDTYTKDVHFPAMPVEVGTRVTKQLVLVALAARAMGTGWDFIKEMIYRITLDSLPFPRLLAMKALANGRNRSKDVARTMRVHTSISTRVLEEMEMLGITRKTSDGSHEIASGVMADAIRSVEG